MANVLRPVMLKIMLAFIAGPSPISVTEPFVPVTRPKSSAKSSHTRNTPG